MQNLNERGAAYIPIAKARGITPHSDKKANECRYHKMANDIIGKQTFVYDGDYDQWIGMFSQDKTEVN